MRLPLLGFVFLLACGSSHSASDAGPGDGAPGDGAPGDGASGGSGALCGGLLPRPCSATEYCDYPDNSCGRDDQAGTCKPRPQVCPLGAAGAPAIAAMPTCACDGKIYSGECEANRAGVDLNANGTCDVPTGEFACGYAQCLVATQYRRRQPHTTGPDTFNCAALPPACSGNQACACLQSEPCGTACTGTGTAGLTLTCPSID